MLLALWDVTSCSLVNRYQCFRRTCALYLLGRGSRTVNDLTSHNRVRSCSQSPNRTRTATDYGRRRLRFVSHQGRWCFVRHSFLSGSRRVSFLAGKSVGALNLTTSASYTSSNVVKMCRLIPPLPPYVLLLRCHLKYICPLPQTQGCSL